MKIEHLLTALQPNFQEEESVHLQAEEVQLKSQQSAEMDIAKLEKIK